MKKVLFEGIFLNKEDVEKAFEMVRGACPLPLKPGDYHVTTIFKPSEPRRELYGEKVVVEIISYKLDSNLIDKNGEIIANEGFSVRLSSENPEVQSMIDMISKKGKNWHITGSFMRKGI